MLSQELQALHHTYKLHILTALGWLGMSAQNAPVEWRKSHPQFKHVSHLSRSLSLASHDLSWSPESSRPFGLVGLPWSTSALMSEFRSWVSIASAKLFAEPYTQRPNQVLLHGHQDFPAAQRLCTPSMTICTSKAVLASFQASRDRITQFSKNTA